MTVIHTPYFATYINIDLLSLYYFDGMVLLWGLWWWLVLSRSRAIPCWQGSKKNIIKLIIFVIINIEVYSHCNQTMQHRLVIRIMRVLHVSSSFNLVITSLGKIIVSGGRRVKYHLYVLRGSLNDKLLEMI